MPRVLHPIPLGKTMIMPLVRHAAVLSLLSWLLIDGRQARGAEARGLPDLAALMPTVQAISDAAGRISQLGCMTPDCIAIVRLRHIFDIIDDSELTTMGDARYYNPNEPDVREKYLHRVLLDHPERLGPMCALLTRLASRYGRPGARQEVDEDLYVGVEAVDIASRMDGHGQPRCLPALLAAMPHTAVADAAIESIRKTCDPQTIAPNLCARISR